MTPTAVGRSIPAPRPVPGPSGRGAVGAGHGKGAADSREVSGHQQPPSKSSLDLVWSYSRSQAFYGENMGTSPSFVEHYAPPGASGISTPADTDSEHPPSSLASDAYGSSSDERSGFNSINDGEDAPYSEDGSYVGESDLYSESDETDDPTPVQSATASEAGGALTPSRWTNPLSEQLPSNACNLDPSRQPCRRPVSGLSNLSPAALQARNDKLLTLEDDEPHSHGEADQSRLYGRSRSRSSSRSRPPFGTATRAGRSTDKGSFSTRGSCRSRGRRARGGSRRDAQVRTRVPANSEGDKALVVGHDTELLHDDFRPPCADVDGRTSENLLRAAAFKPGMAKGVAYPVGTSTFLQSWFNTLNAVMGVGILATPLAFSYAGYIMGPLLFLLCGLLTNYTGKVLFGILARNGKLRTYADIGSCAFGPHARAWISSLFCLELWAVCVALVILFSDSLHAIFPDGPSRDTYKVLCLAFVLPTIFLPLKLLSPISVVGILAAFTLVGVVAIDGFIKPTSPGSLHEWDTTVSASPDWLRLPLSIGLIMSGFSSHPVIPSLARDMKEPNRFPSMLNRAYITAAVVYITMAGAGYAMFGTSVSDEITKDLARTPGFPEGLNRVAVWLMVINPLSKFALASQPIINTLEGTLGIEEPHPAHNSILSPRHHEIRSYGTLEAETASTPRSACLSNQPDGSPAIVRLKVAPLKQSLHWNLPPPATSGEAAATAPLARPASSQREPAWYSLARAGVRVAIAGLITLTAILLPGFEKTMAFLGSFLVITTCVLGPLLANLKLFGHEMSRARIVGDVIILVVSFVAAILGTVWSFLT